MASPRLTVLTVQGRTCCLPPVPSCTTVPLSSPGTSVGKCTDKYFALLLCLSWEEAAVTPRVKSQKIGQGFDPGIQLGVHCYVVGQNHSFVASH